MRLKRSLALLAIFISTVQLRTGLQTAWGMCAYMTALEFLVKEKSDDASETANRTLQINTHTAPLGAVLKYHKGFGQKALE